MRSVLFFEPMSSPATDSKPHLLDFSTPVSSVAPESGLPEGSHAIEKEG